MKNLFISLFFIISAMFVTPVNGAMGRDEIIQKLLPKIQNGIFVEIGTHTGYFADKILSTTNDSTLYCIDPYMRYDNYHDAINGGTGDKYYNDTVNFLKSKYGDRVIFIRELSSAAIGLIPNNVDFVYIDGNHQYEFVYNDLELYYPKVKSGGYIMGDDAVDTDESKRNSNGNIYIEWSPGSYGEYGVLKAYRDFLKKMNIEGELIGNQFIIKKP